MGPTIHPEAGMPGLVWDFCHSPGTCVPASSMLCHMAGGCSPQVLSCMLHPRHHLSLPAAEWEGGKGGRGGLLSLKKSVKCFHLATWMHLQSKRWWPPAEAQSTGFADERREGLNIEATENLDPNTKELRKTSCLLSTKL